MRRAYDLGMIDAVKYRGACIYLRKSGQAKREQGDDYIEIESSNLLTNITKTLVDDYIGDIVEFIKNRGWSEELLEKITSIKLPKLKETIALSSSSKIVDINQYRFSS